MNKSRLAVNAIFFINGFTYANWASRIPLIQDHFDLDHRALGLTLLSASIGALLAMPFTGWVISRRGSRQVTILSSLLFLISVPLFTLSPNAWWLLVSFFFMGMSTGTMDVAMNAQAVYVEKDLGQPVMSFFHALFSLGMMAGAAAGSFFTSIHWHLLPHFSSISLCGLVVLLGSFRFLLPDTDSGKKKSGNAPVRLPDVAVIGIGLIAFCSMLGEGAMADWSTVYIREIVVSGDAWAPAGLFAFSMAMTTGRLLGDKARLAWGDRKLLITGSAFSLAGITLIITLPQIGLVIAGLFLIGLGMSTIVPIAYSQAGNLPGYEPGVGISMVTTIGYAGFLFGPPVIGYLADWLDLQKAFSFIATLFLLMFALSLAQKKD